jgi:serine/threonine-protein kinase
MAPEQAKGKAVDKRADIWAFGCILFECLTSKRAFAGETVTETLAAILKGEPDWSELPAFTALKAKDLLRRCLEKDPRRRLHDVADARIEIDDALSTRVTGAAAELQDKQHRAPRLRLLALGLTVGAAITSGMVIGALLWNYVRWTRPAPQLPMRFVLPLPPSSDIEVGVAQAVLAISPDGSQLVYVARSEGTTQLFLRRIGQLDILPIAGTEGATGPFFSPEGAWVGFFAGGSLKKVSLAGGSLVTICESAGRGPHSGIWTADGTIIFAPEYNTGLSRISSDGGRLQPVTIPNPTLRETSHGWPQILPGGQTILYTVKPGNIASYDDAQIVVKRLGTTAPKILIRGATYARYVPTGHLVYARAGKLFAVPFDLNNLSVTGSPMPILEGLITVPSYGSAQYAFSDTGLLAYVPGGALPPKDRFLLWVDSHGGQQAIMSRRNNYAELRFSPDGLRLAVRIAAANDDVWLYEPARDTLTRLTDEDGDEVSPVWTPKGDRVAYSSEAGGAANLFWKASDGSGLPEPLLINEHTKYPGSFSPNGEFLAFVDVDPTNGRDIWLLSIQGERKAKPFRRTQFDEWEPKFSPDGRWLAYASNRTGRDEIYIEPFPGPGGQQQISTNGGDHPVWVHNGQELFYRNGNKMMAVSIDAQSGKPGTGRMLFEGNYFQSRLFACYDVARDGRFLMVSSPQPGAALTQINVVVNWFEELKRLVPTGK